jgi:poly(glycerol-phosphate) alpha-glucosyltransferase
MRVAMISASISRAAGGIFEIERRLSQELSETKAVTVDVFGIEDEFTQADLLQWLPLRPRTFPSIGPESFAYCPQLLAALDTAKPDLAHLHSLWQYPSVAVQHWAANSRRPAIITAHGMLHPWALRNSKWKKRIALWFYEGRNLRSAKCIQVNTTAEMTSVRELGLTNPIAVIPNGVDVPGGENSSSCMEPWAQGRKVLLYVGRIHPKKGLPHLVRAWSRQRTAAGGGWVVAIAGWDQGGHENEIKALATQLGIPWLDVRTHNAGELSKPAGDLIFLGPQFGADKDRLFRHSDALVLPSFSEGLPMAVLEGWAYGKPVMITPMCNLSEGFAAGAALCIEPKPDSIASGLADLFALSDEDRIYMGARGRRLVEERFAWPQAAAQMLEVYSWILGIGPRPDCVFI